MITLYIYNVLRAQRDSGSYSTTALPTGSQARGASWQESTQYVVAVNRSALSSFPLLYLWTTPD